MPLFENKTLMIFSAKDLVGRTVHIKSIREGDFEAIVAIDVKTQDLFLLDEIDHRELPTGYIDIN